MEGNFLSRYNNKMDQWKEMIQNDPLNKNKYESEMADYVMKCMPYMNEHTKEITKKQPQIMFLMLKKLPV